MKQLKERIHNMIHSMATPGPLFLVFHDNSQDIKYLRSPEIDAPLDGLSSFLLESCTETETSDTPKIYVVDTSELFYRVWGVTRAGRNTRLSVYAAYCRSNLVGALEEKMTVHILGPRKIAWWGSARYVTGCMLAAAHKQ